MTMVSLKAYASFIFACDTWVHMQFPACVAVCCSVLQCVAASCSVSQRVAVHMPFPASHIY